MDIRNFVIAIRDTNTEQINMIMTRDDYDRYLSDLYHENKTDLTNIHDSLAKLRESFIAPTLSDWSNIYFSDNTALYARYCENDEMLTDFLSGKYNKHGTWRIDYDHITDACKDYLIKGLLSNREINEKKHIVNRSVAGYRIINKMDFRDRYGAYSSIVMGNNENAAAPWATWRYFPEHDNYDYGHYFMSEENAIKDFFERGVELTKVNLREEYINEMIIDDIKEVLSYDYHEWEIAELMSDESFISKAIDSWHSIDRSDDNDSLIKKLNSIINGASVSFNEIDEAQQTNERFSDKVLCYGKKNGQLYILQEHFHDKENYFSLFIIEDKDIDMPVKSIDFIMAEYNSSGYSISGGLDEILDEAKLSLDELDELVVMEELPVLSQPEFKFLSPSTPENKHTVETKKNYTYKTK